MKMNKLMKFSEIKEPTSVEEFRENLKKYYVNTDGQLITMSTSYTRDTYIDIDSLDSMDDLRGDTNIQVTPTYVQSGDWEDFCKGKYQDLQLYGLDWLTLKWWENDDNNIIVDYSNEKQRSIDLDDVSPYHTFTELTREYQDGNIWWMKYWKEEHTSNLFFRKTLGKFSGHGSYSEVLKVWKEEIV
jgi:hypothetical protein